MYAALSVKRNRILSDMKHLNNKIGDSAFRAAREVGDADSQVEQSLGANLQTREQLSRKRQPSNPQF
jgi:hypothetical protein